MLSSIGGHIISISRPHHTAQFLKSQPCRCSIIVGIVCACRRRGSSWPSVTPPTALPAKHPDQNVMRRVQKHRLANWVVATDTRSMLFPTQYRAFNPALFVCHPASSAALATLESVVFWLFLIASTRSFVRALFPMLSWFLGPRA